MPLKTGGHAFEKGIFMNARASGLPVTLQPDATRETMATRETLPVSEWIKAGSLRRMALPGPVLDAEAILDYPADRPRFRRILFVAPQPHGYDVPPAPTPSFGYLGELLTEQGFEWQLLDLRLGGGLDEVRSAIETYRPDVIGYTFQFTIGADHCARFLHEIAKVTDLPLLIGGAHLAIRGHNIFEDVPPLFAACYKEGEYPLLAIMKGVPLEQIPNLWMRDGDVVRETPTLGYVNELDSLPWPQYAGYDFSRFAYEGQIDVLTSRGCPYQCTFCSVALTQGRRFRRRSPENVVSEIRYWYDRGVRNVNFIDDILTVNKKRFHGLLDRILAERFAEPVNFSCVQGMRADACDAELLQKMRAVGFDFLGFGVESGSDRILEIIKKGETVEEIDRAVESSCREGFTVGLFFIIGSPTETVEDVEKSFAFARRHPVKYAKFHVCVPYPGTALASWVDENSTWYVRPDDYLQDFSYHDDLIVFDNKGMSLEEHRRMVRRSVALDCEVRQKFAYTHMRDRGLPGFVALPASHALYHPQTFRHLRSFAKSALGVRIRRHVVRTLRLQDGPAERTSDISFSDGQ